MFSLCGVAAALMLRRLTKNLRMKSFFLKVSLLAGLSLSGFCSVFAQSNVGGGIKYLFEGDFKSGFN